MNSSVTCASATSVMSSLCLAIRPSRRSNGPLKLVRWTSNALVPTGALAPVGPEADCSGGTARSSGGVATGDELTCQLTVGRRTGVRRGVRGDRLGGDGGVGELHRAADDRVQ